MNSFSNKKNDLQVYEQTCKKGFKCHIWLLKLKESFPYANSFTSSTYGGDVIFAHFQSLYVWFIFVLEIDLWQFQHTQTTEMAHIQEESMLSSVFDKERTCK